MITTTETKEVNISPTKKDYYQIWNELMEITASLSERWNPQYTNESDPGIVLLKVLTAVGDKLSYNTDKATLEHFMPSATQVESVRSICSTLGYEMKYYVGATCDVTFTANSSAEASTSNPIYFPKFTNVKNSDSSVNYVTLEEFTLTNTEGRQISCMEGTLCECATDNDNIITLNQLDTQNRYILPEANIAENGVFVSNIIVVGDVSSESSPWTQVSNLNTVLSGAKAYKFGYDSKEQLPYIQFTDEISTLIGDGLRIKYIRTNGYNGNVSKGTLTVLEVPSIWSTATDSAITGLSASDFTLTNYSASTNGADPETIDSAYANFKKTIGTFDTLVTCRDYMSAIYKMTKSDYDTTPLVSNIITTDVRDDINSAQTLCSFNEYGICYSSKSKSHYRAVGELSETQFNTEVFTKGQELYVWDKTKQQYVKSTSYDGTTEHYYYKFIEDINKFDLVLYPFKTVKGLNDVTEYKNSFKYNAENLTDIIANLQENKTLAHNIITPDYLTDNLVAIKNYVQLKCKITTVKKVSAAQEQSILNNIYSAIYTNFNARKMDFGEQVSVDLLENVIKNADSLIKDISLDTSTIVTKFLTADNEEYTLLAADENIIAGSNALSASILYNRLALRNVLAGKIAAFDYDTDFAASFSETTYPGYARSYPTNNDGTIITKITSSFDLGVADPESGELTPINTQYTLKEHEVIQFTAPNFRTTTTYPAYVNYYMHYAAKAGASGLAANMISIKDYLNDTLGTSYHTRWDAFMLALKEKSALTSIATDDWSSYTEAQLSAALKSWLSSNAPVLIVTTANTIEPYQGTHVLLADDIDNAIDWYGNAFWKKQINASDKVCFNLDVKTNLNKISTYFKQLEADEDTKNTEDSLFVYTASDRSLYLKKTQTVGLTGGRLVDENGYKYVKCTSSVSGSDQLSLYYVPKAVTSQGADESYIYERDGIGKDAEYSGQANNTQYKLAAGDYLLINYTNSTTDSDGNSISNVVNKMYYYDPSSADHNTPIFIKANFDLIDSSEYHSTHSYSKESGFEFDSDHNPDGMFALNTDEQIEICEQIKVELNDNVAYICWSRQDDDANKNDSGDVQFTFDEISYDAPEGLASPNDYVWTDPTGITVANSYTLKDNEYFYYTDSAKQSLVYYGKGTTIRRYRYTPDLYKRSNDVDPDTKTIEEYGLLASLPWHAYALNDTSGRKRGLTLIENQLISLTEGDTLIGVQAYDAQGNEPSPDEATYSPTSIQAVLKTGVQTSIYSARYKLAESDTAEDLPIAPSGSKWKGTARLDISMTQTEPQTLHEYDAITLYGTNDYSQVIKPTQYETTTATDGTEALTIVPLNLYASSPCVTTNNVLSTALYDNDNNIEDYNLAFRVAKTSIVEIGSSNNKAVLNLNNYSNYWTKVTFSAYKDFADNGTVTFTLNADIGTSGTGGTERFGLIMFYYLDDYTKVSGHSNCKLTANTETLSRFSTWTKNTANVKELVLQPGINIIRVSNRCTSLTVTSDAGVNALASTIVFSELDIISGINNKLDYRVTNTQYTSALEQLLADIQSTGLANDFYYNTVVSSSNKIDLNDNIEDELLSSADCWYDANNVNKKFVISEIDYNYLSKGIALTKQSRSS